MGVFQASAADYTRRVVRGDRSTGGGWFVTIEGPDGSGKTSVASTLHARLAARGHDVLLTREPGGTALGDRIRGIVLARGGSADAERPGEQSGPGAGRERHDVAAVRIDPRADALLFSAARAEHVDEVILPALRRGTTVICARFSDSTLAYQGAGSGLPIDELREIQRFATDGLRPDLTILLDLPVEVGLSRKSDEQTRFEVVFDHAYHRRVREAFLAFAAAEPGRFVVVDATAPRSVVELTVLGIVDRRLPDLAKGVAAEPSEPGAGPQRMTR